MACEGCIAHRATIRVLEDALREERERTHRFEDERSDILAAALRRSGILESDRDSVSRDERNFEPIPGHKSPRTEVARIQAEIHKRWAEKAKIAPLPPEPEELAQ